MEKNSPPVSAESFRIASPVFHSTLLCEDFDNARDTLSRLFGIDAQDGGSWAGRRATFVPVGDVWIEAMVPVSRTPNRGSLAKFLQRFGQHWHSLAWHVESVQPLADRLGRAGVRVFDSDGRLITGEVPAHGPFPTGEMTPFEDGWESRVFFTSLRDSHGGLEFVEPTAPHPFLPKLEPIARADPGGLGVTRCTHHTFVVHLVDAAVDFWVRTIGAEIIARHDNRAAGTRSVFVRFGAGAGNIVELAQPIARGAAREDLEDCGIDMLHASHFHVCNLRNARDHLIRNGFDVEWADAHQFMLAPSSTLGARFGFTDRNQAPFS